jgi:hypothetical protein
MKKFIAVFALLFVASLSLSADIYIKTKTHQDAMAMMGQTTPAKDSVSEQWIGDDMFAQVTPDQSMIINVKKNMAWIINHKAKNYIETPLPLDMSKLLPPEAAAFAGMMKMTATVSATNETKKIGQWNCQGYTMNMSVMGMNISTKVWASTDVGFDATAFNAKFMGNIMKGQMMLDDASIKEFGKIKGYQIMTEADMFGAKTTTEVVEISPKKTAPAGIYALPAGYTKTTSLSMDALKK